MLRAVDRCQKGHPGDRDADYAYGDDEHRREQIGHERDAERGRPAADLQHPYACGVHPEKHEEGAGEQKHGPGQRDPSLRERAASARASTPRRCRAAPGSGAPAFSLLAPEFVDIVGSPPWRALDAPAPTRRPGARTRSRSRSRRAPAERDRRTARRTTCAPSGTTGGRDRLRPPAVKISRFVPFESKPRPMISCARRRRSIRYIPAVYRTPDATASSDLHQDSSTRLKIIISTTPVTTRNTPTSNRAGVPRVTGPRAHNAVRNGRATKDGRQTADQGDEQAGAEKRQGLHEQRLSRTPHPECDAVQGERRGRDEAADKAATRLVMAAKQQEHREQQEQRHEQPRSGTEDWRVHGLYSVHGRGDHSRRIAAARERQSPLSRAP